MRRSLTIILIVLLFILTLPASVSAQEEPPQLPALYWGTVTVYKQTQQVGAPIGTIITALVDGVERGSITTTEPGKYGAIGLHPKLTVQGDNLGGREVEFYVNGIQADEVTNFQNENPEEIDLSVEDLVEPVISKLNPALGTTVNEATPTISADYSDALSGVDSTTAKIEVDSTDVTEGASVTEEEVSYTPTAALANGTHDVRVTVADKLENSTSQEWSFTVSVIVGGGGFGGASPPTGEEVKTNLFGTEASFPISSSGEILETIEATSEDGTLTLTILEDTIALDKEDNPLETLEAEVDTSHPPLPEDTSIIGLAYDFGPDEATFDPPITLTRSYDPNDIPEGVAEEDLVLAWYDETGGRWVELSCIVDTENNTITASIEHFTTFAIIGATAPSEPAPVPTPAAFTPSSLRLSPVEANIGDEVTISLFVVNTGGKSGSYEMTLKINGVVEAVEEIKVSAGFSKEVTFTTSKDIADTYSVDVNGLTDSFTVKEKEAVTPAPSTSPPAEETSPPLPAEETDLSPPAEETDLSLPAKEINWPVLGGVIGGVVVIGLLIFFVVRRRVY